MGDEYYRKFFYILKRFAKDNNYKLSYYLFNIEYELRLDEKCLLFYITTNDNKKYVSFEDAYKIIKENVGKILRHKQISKFKYHSKDTNKKIIFSESESKIYNRLTESFIPYLYAEYLEPLSIFENAESKMIWDCFYDLNIPVEFLRKLLEIVSFDKSTLVEGCISKDEISKTFSEGLWYNELIKMQEKMYIILKEKDGNIEEILLTEKFLKKLKKLIFLNFT